MPEAKQFIVRSTYLSKVINTKSLALVVSEAVKLLRPKRDSFDGIAVRGASGLLVGPTVALRLHKQLIIVRKMGENHHSQSSVEGVYCPKYIILDDMIETGETLKTIRDTVENYTWGYQKMVPYRPIQSPQLTGVYLYDHLDSYRTPKGTLNNFEGWFLSNLDSAKAT